MTCPFTHRFTSKANLQSPVLLLACFWEGGRHQRTQLKPTQAQEEHANPTQTVT